MRLLYLIYHTLIRHYDEIGPAIASAELNEDDRYIKTRVIKDTMAILLINAVRNLIQKVTTVQDLRLLYVNSEMDDFPEMHHQTRPVINQEWLMNIAQQNEICNHLAVSALSSSLIVSAFLEHNLFSAITTLDQISNHIPYLITEILDHLDLMIGTTSHKFSSAYIRAIIARMQHQHLLTQIH